MKIESQAIASPQFYVKNSVVSIFSETNHSGVRGSERSSTLKQTTWGICPGKSFLAGSY